MRDLIAYVTGVALLLGSCATPPRSTDTSRLLLRRIRAIASDMSTDETEWRPECERAFEDEANGSIVVSDPYRYVGHALSPNGKKIEKHVRPGSLSTSSMPPC